ncbi:AMP-binding protein [Abyssalbus ytuae]|uniref:AMP-binding protein n=1 Tax=Abyssalbus ytuae TaxID=2926907 RepID=A0A9E7A0B5_9FLAO|nr:AMP-binding protein [Abyssalbus ytuae]UOB17316.1 AMP-binding protein [Abyssalbus ytuae]
MSTPTFDKVHLKFKLNGLHYDREELKEVAFSFVKEGEPYEQSMGDYLMDWLNNKDHLFVKTSGSTGTPKLIRINKQHMVNSAIASGDFFGITMGDTALHCLPADFIAGKMMLVRAMVLGLEIDLVRPSLNPLQGIKKDYDFSAMIPLQLKNSLNNINHIKKLIVGGAYVPGNLVEKIQNIPTEVYETYGMTETVTHIAAKKLNNFNSEEEKNNIHFKLLPNIKISKDDRDCMVIDAPDISEERIVTNDIVKIISGEEFDWIGRHDNVINSGGVKLIPESIEAKISGAIPNRFYVTGKDDENLGKKLVLVVEGGNNNKEDIINKVKSVPALDRYEIPKEFIFVDNFKETENGKIIRELIY